VKRIFECDLDVAFHCANGATENARPYIARPSKLWGQRETI